MVETKRRRDASGFTKAAGDGEASRGEGDVKLAPTLVACVPAGGGGEPKSEGTPQEAVGAAVVGVVEAAEVGAAKSDGMLAVAAAGTDAGVANNEIPGASVLDPSAPAAGSDRTGRLGDGWASLAAALVGSPAAARSVGPGVALELATLLVWSSSSSSAPPPMWLASELARLLRRREGEGFPVATAPRRSCAVWAASTASGNG